MSLKKILSAAAFTLAGLAGNASAQDDCDPRSDNLTATYVATLTGAIGENAKKHLLELAAEGFRQEPWESRMRAFEKHFGSAQKPVDKDNSFRPAFGYVTHVSEPDKKKCVVYLYHDTNKNGIQDIGGDVQPELQERELLCIPRNTLIDERNAPYVAACDEHVGAFEKIFTYQLFVPPEKDISTKYRFANTHGKKQKQEMKQCLLATARDGIQRHKEQFVLSSEGAAVMSSIDNLFENPATIAENGYGVAVFTFGKQHYSFLFRDENTNGEHDKGEPLLSIIQKNDTITPYTAECAIPPEQGVMTLDEKIEQLKGDNKYAEIAHLLVQEGRKKEAIGYYVAAKEPNKAASLAESIGELELAAQAFAQGGLHKEAGRVLAEAGLSEKAAEAYKQGKWYKEAGETAEQAGKLELAADAYTKGGLYQKAGQVLEEAGKPELAADAYTKGGLYQKAGRVLAKAGLTEKALKAYKQGGLNPPDHVTLRSHGSYSTVGRLLKLYVGTVDETGISRAVIYEDGKEIKTLDKIAGFELVDIEKKEAGVHTYQVEVEDKEGNILRSKPLKIEFSGTIVDRVPHASLRDWSKSDQPRIGVIAGDEGDNAGLSKAILYEDGVEVESWTDEKIIFGSYDLDKPGKHTYQLEVTDLGGHTVKSGVITVEFGELEKKASENTKTFRERLMNVVGRTKTAENKIERKERDEETEFPGRFALYPSFYSPVEGDNLSPHVHLLADLFLLFQNGMYIQLGGGGRLEWAPSLRNVVFRDKESGTTLPADWKDNGAELLRYSRVGINIGMQIGDWLFVHGIGGTDSYDFETDSYTLGGAKLKNYFSGILGAGTKVSFVGDRLTIALDVEYNVNNSIKRGAYKTKDNAKRIILELPDQKHPNARVHLTYLNYLNDTGLYLQLVALSEGANVSPMCDIFSCSGMYGRTSAGGKVGIVGKVDDEAYLTGALEGRVETSGLDGFYDYENAFMGGVSIGLVVNPSEKMPVSALLLPEMR